MALLVLVAVVTALLLFGKLTPDNWVELTKWLAGFFFGANAVEHSPKVVDAVSGLFKRKGRLP